MRELERIHGRKLEEILQDLKYREGLTYDQIAQRLGVPAGTVGTWFVRLGIGPFAMAHKAAEAS